VYFYRGHQFVAGKLVESTLTDSHLWLSMVIHF